MLLKDLCAAAGVSGDETEIRNLIASHLSWCDMHVDAMGNLLASRPGNGKKILFAAHMDEVGLIISGIEDNGFLRFKTVGGINTDVLLGKKVYIGRGKIPGIVGVCAVHLQSRAQREGVVREEDMYIDIGAADRAEAASAVSLGDTAVFPPHFEEFGDNLIEARAIDDRAGCAVLIKLLQNQYPDVQVCCAFTAQEEVGTRGAKAASFTVAPDIAIVLETTTACDIAGVSGDKRVCVLGDGCVISYMDRSTVYDRQLYQLAFDTAKELGVPAQTKTVVAGGNDSGAIHVSRGGVRTCALSVPCRYLHSPSCVIKQSDHDAVKALAFAMAERCAEL